MTQPPPPSCAPPRTVPSLNRLPDLGIRTPGENLPLPLKKYLKKSLNRKGLHESTCVPLYERNSGNCVAVNRGENNSRANSLYCFMACPPHPSSKSSLGVIEAMTGFPFGPVKVRWHVSVKKSRLLTTLRRKARCWTTASSHMPSVGGSKTSRCITWCTDGVGSEIFMKWGEEATSRAEAANLKQTPPNKLHKKSQGKQTNRHEGPKIYVRTPKNKAGKTQVSMKSRRIEQGR